MEAQRGKLVAELEFLIDAATSSGSTGDLTPFVDRARELGRRHVDYGVAGRDYAYVGQALVTAVAEHSSDWDDEHERAWTKLYRLISDVMREGASGALFTGS
jgi:hemoglobin-like flavoprotein